MGMLDYAETPAPERPRAVSDILAILQSLSLNDFNHILNLKSDKFALDIRSVGIASFISHATRNHPSVWQSALGGLSVKKQDMLKTLTTPIIHLSSKQSRYAVFTWLTRQIASQNIDVADKLGFTLCDWILHLNAIFLDKRDSHYASRIYYLDDDFEKILGNLELGNISLFGALKDGKASIFQKSQVALVQIFLLGAVCGMTYHLFTSSGPIAWKLFGGALDLICVLLLLLIYLVLNRRESSKHDLSEKVLGYLKQFSLVPRTSAYLHPDLSISTFARISYLFRSDPVLAERVAYLSAKYPYTIDRFLDRYMSKDAPLSTSLLTKALSEVVLPPQVASASEIQAQPLLIKTPRND